MAQTEATPLPLECGPAGGGFSYSDVRLLFAVVLSPDLLPFRLSAKFRQVLVTRFLLETTAKIHIRAVVGEPTSNSATFSSAQPALQNEQT